MNAERPAPSAFAPDRTRILSVILLILTALTGVIDAESFLSLGHVFTANMTGNVVFIAFACAGVPGLSVARSGTALLGFLTGAALGAGMARGIDRTKATRRLAAVLFIQATSLLVAATVAIGSPGRVADVQTHLYLVIALTSLAMGVQNATAMKLAVSGLSPNVLTTALTWVAAESPLVGGHDPVWTSRLASVAAMFGGALIGAWLWHVSDVWPLALCALLSAVCSAAILERHSKRIFAIIPLSSWFNRWQ